MNNRLIIGFVLLMLGAMPTFSQVSNDNEDGVNKVNQHFSRNYVPGQVLVKFKDNSNISIQRNAEGRFRAASINTVDKLLKDFCVEEMENLYVAEKAKPTSQLRSRKGPNGTIVKERNLDKVFLLKMSEDKSVIDLVSQLKEMSDVEYAEPNYKVFITADVPFGIATESPNQKQLLRRAPTNIETNASVICAKPSQNPLYFRQYGITQQNIHKLWNKPIINKKRPVIAILDTGVDINHPDLKDNIWANTIEIEGETAYDDDGNGIVDDKYGWNFVDGYYDLTDRNGHGTHVAGIAAASDNNIGIVGANPLALIMPVKVMNDRGEGDIATICRGIIYAAENGADIINMSFGSPNLSNTEKDALEKAYQTCILVASAGNNAKEIYDMNGLSGTSYPAAYYLVLGVEASGSNGQLTAYSNYDPDGPIYSEDGIDGRNYEIQFPGDKIYSTIPGGKYNQLSGTSMSSPLLAGAISALQMVKVYPSKDVLFGDLIYLKADFEKIFSADTPRMPKIDLVSMNVDDNVEGNGNIDGQIDAGETIKFTPTLINTWADAKDISLNIEVDPEYANYVEIENPQIDFGYSLSAYGRSSSKNPFIIKFAKTIGDNTRIRFQVKINHIGETDSSIHYLYSTVNNKIKIGGIVNQEMTLHSDKMYCLTSDMAISEGAKLIIEPGTVIEMLGDIYNYGDIVVEGEPNKMITLDKGLIYSSKPVILKYCIFPNITSSVSVTSYTQSLMLQNVHYEDCIFSSQYGANTNLVYFNCTRCNQIDLNLSDTYYDGCCLNKDSEYNNIINNYLLHIPNSYSYLKNCNYVNINANSYYDNIISYSSITPSIDHAEFPSYLGTGLESVIRPYIEEKQFGRVDLSNMPNRPYAEAHGMVWKVCVNGKDAQDEYEDLAPLGVGRHKFEVYFNRPMNKAVAPQIAFGVREPYTQNAVAENGSWNEEGTIYTAYKTIDGKTKSDGVNRIYVWGAEDNEYFEIPYEKTRFNINVQAAGSMATGFAAEAGMGRVNLTWNNDNNNFDDAMGFNIYRYTIDTEGKADTLRLNTDIVDIETTEYSDYEVTPGITYYYMYKVLSTDLKEYDVSNVVAATPLTATLGDANGSGDVDVADVITTVNYAAGMEPKPFIFEAADMNTDQSIDILDVIGIIQKILNPAGACEATIEATAVYTIEDGILYVESPIALAGVQAQLNMDTQQEVIVAEDLNGFEHMTAWLSDNDMLFMAYNLNGKTLSAGKHALLKIGDADVTNMRLSDAQGHNVLAVAGETTSISAMGSKVQQQGGVFNLKGQKIAAKASDLQKLPKGVYIINGEKVVK